MDGGGRLVELAGDAAIEIGVVGGADLRLRLGPQRGAVADLGRLAAGLLDDRDRHRHVARLRLDEPLDGEALGIGFGVIHQMQHDAGAARRRVGKSRGRNGKRALAVRRPQPGRLRAGAARQHLDPLRHHEGRIEADAEPADQRGLVVGLFGLDAVEERLGARARDGAERFRKLVAAHADAVVLDGQAFLLGIERERDARLDIVAEQRRVGDRLVAQPLAGVGGIGDQFAQKYRFIGIDRVHHQVQQLGDVGLERLGLGRPAFRYFLLGSCHDRSPNCFLFAPRWRGVAGEFKIVGSVRRPALSPSPLIRPSGWRPA